MVDCNDFEKGFFSIEQLETIKNSIEQTPIFIILFIDIASYFLITWIKHWSKF